jgi:hypothetical protein
MNFVIKDVNEGIELLKEGYVNSSDGMGDHRVLEEMYKVNERELVLECEKRWWGD